MGFLRDYRRINVAMTRARSRLILVGDLSCLSRSGTAHGEGKHHGQWLGCMHYIIHAFCITQTADTVRKRSVNAYFVPHNLCMFFYLVYGDISAAGSRGDCMPKLL